MPTRGNIKNHGILIKLNSILQRIISVSYTHLDVYKRQVVSNVLGIRVASAYLTLSEPAVMMITGSFPICLLAKERRAVRLRKEEIGMEMAKLQKRIRTPKDNK